MSIRVQIQYMTTRHSEELRFHYAPVGMLAKLGAFLTGDPEVLSVGIQYEDGREVTYIDGAPYDARTGAEVTNDEPPY